MARLKIDIVGLEALQAKMKGRAQEVSQALGVGLYRLGSAIISDSVRLAPKKYGTLRASAYCTLPQGSGTLLSVTVGYGGYAKAYAFIQHERLDYHHAEGQAKYLETVVQRYQGRAADIVLEQVRRSLRDGSVSLPGAVVSTDPNAGPPPPKGGSRGGSRRRR